MTAQSIALKPSEIRPIIDATFPEYRGPKASVRIQATAEYSAADLCWQDGSSVAGVGYNGALPGQPHCAPETCNPSARCFNTRHAERSALDYSTGDIAAAYVTHEPCLRCTQDLIARGCRAIYYLRSYDIADAAEERARLQHRETNNVSWVKMEGLCDM